MLGYFDKDQIVNYTFNPLNKCLFIFVIEGSIGIENTTLQKGDALGIWDTSSIAITNLQPSQFLIIETVINQK